jgi:hypothetical protein
MVSSHTHRYQSDTQRRSILPRRYTCTAAARRRRWRRSRRESWRNHRRSWRKWHRSNRQRSCKSTRPNRPHTCRRWRTGCLSTAHVHNIQHANVSHVSRRMGRAERARIVQSTHLIDVGLTGRTAVAGRAGAREAGDAVRTRTTVQTWASGAIIDIDFTA